MRRTGCEACAHSRDLLYSSRARKNCLPSDFTYVRTYSDFCYTAFITDVFSRKIVGWGGSSTMHTLGMPLTALKQVLFEAKKSGSDVTQIVHH